MTTMTTCPACNGIAPDGAALCPHCDAPLAAKKERSGLAARALAVLSAGAASVTLMACYGAPPTKPDSSWIDKTPKKHERTAREAAAAAHAAPAELPALPTK